MIKTFRGILTDGQQNRIRLSTKKGKIGYRIVKFEIMTEEPYGGASAEHIMKIYKILQTAVTADVDFADGNLLAVAITNNSTAGYQYATVPSVIFDREIFNQDIYITHLDNASAQNGNYYLELETIALSDNATLVSTLRDIRLNPQVGA